MRKMLRDNIIILLIYLTICHGEEVNFPDDDDNNNNNHHQPEMRIGSKYLGYFLSLLSTTITGYQAAPVQTPSETPPPPPPPPPPALSASTGASTFPTALPDSIPTGLVTSFGTFPPIVTTNPIEIPAQLTNNDGYICGCLPVSVCVNETTRGGASVRIVTPPPQGVACPTGMVYCCSPNMRHLCGLQNIVPGVTPGVGQANLGEFPWSAIILTDNGDYVGGGALIDDLHVLTAAHKVANYGNGGNLKIRFGDWDLSSNREPVRELEVKVRSIITHPSYDSVNLRNDVAIITLTSSVPRLSVTRPQINAICLASPVDSFVGATCWVAGWGKDHFRGVHQQVLKRVDVAVVEAGDCQRRLRQTRLGNDFLLDTNSFLCAGGEANKDACTGDGGNALACMKNGQFYIAGITVGGVECGLANVPGLYVNMVNYVGWVESVIKPSVQGIDPRRKPTVQG